jgi:ubiquinone/menaquinone biosynthesis C-methylase UbiE
VVIAKFSDVTELAGDPVSQEQWIDSAPGTVGPSTSAAARTCLKSDVGPRLGLELLGGVASSLVAGDISDDILSCARAHCVNRADIRVVDAMALPLPDSSLDVVLIFEALYHAPDPRRFVAECARVLRVGGVSWWQMPTRT